MGLVSVFVLKGCQGGVSKSSSGSEVSTDGEGGEASQLLEREVQIRQIKGWRRDSEFGRG